MERVTGIGGFFFASADPEALNAWYERHLGLRQAGITYGDGSWWQDEGPTVFGGEPADGNFGPPGKTWRINFRVADLDAMAAQLRSAGIVVTIDPEIYPNGRFAHLHDPDGNSIELWQSGGTDAARPRF
ncbi:MAG: VOC family protein [Verrucomicrobiaceae bacterium]|nr:MAG: VOC family protein [Verrucomicrobiaceae bacterium]